MNCILLSLLGRVFAVVENVGLSSLYPVYEYYDNNPYIQTTIFSNTSQLIEFDIGSDTDIYLNSVLVTSINQTSNLSLALNLGYNTLTTVSDGYSTNFIIPVSLGTDLNHTVTIGGVACSPFNCGNTSSSSVSLYTKVAGYSGRLFAMNNRQGQWMSITSSLAFQLYVGYNYLQLIYNNIAMIYTIYKIPNASTATSIQILGVNAYLVPRFTPDVFAYSVSPKLDSISGLVYSLQTYCYRPCNLTYSSTSGLWNDATAASGTVVNSLSVSYPSDLVIIKTKDSTGTISYYYLTISVKNRNRYLQTLKIYSPPWLGSMNTYSDINSCCNSTLVNAAQTFNPLINNYNIPDMNYSDAAFTYILLPQDSNADIKLNGVNYLENSKNVDLVVGVNIVNIIVIAEDPGYSNTYSISFYVRSNISSLSAITIPGTLQPLFDPSCLSYSLYLDYYLNTVPVTFVSTDPNAVLELNAGAGIESSASYINTTIGVDVLRLSISLLVSAETPSFSTTYFITLLKNDACGNGIRFSVAEQCDDRNLANGDGCSSTCTIEAGWTCSGGSPTSPDKCQPIQPNTNPISSPGNPQYTKPSNSDNTNSTETQPGTQDPSPTVGTNNTNVYENSTVDPSNTITYNNETVEANETSVYSSQQFNNTLIPLKQNGFEYVGTVCFFIYCIGAIFLISLIHTLGYIKPGISIVPGVIFPLALIQVVCCFKSITSNDYIFFEAFGWSHLQFYKPIYIKSRSNLDLLGVYSTTTPVFLDNIQYFIYLLLSIIIINAFIAVFLSKSVLIRIQHAMYISFFLISAVPILFFSGYSITNPLFDNYKCVISYCLSVIALICYTGGFLHFIIYLNLNREKFSCTIIKYFTSGLRTHQVSIPSSNNNESNKDVPVEHHSFDEDICASNQARTSARRDLDKTDCKIKSEPISVYKYKSPELVSITEVTLPIAPNSYVYEILLLSLLSFIIGCLNNYPEASCSVSILMSFGLIGFIVIVSPYSYNLYTCLHAFMLSMLLFTCILLYTDGVSGKYYPVIVLAAGLLVSFVYQCVDMMAAWLQNSDHEVRQFTLSNHDPSLSYARDSVPEERGPESATINHFSQEISANEDHISDSASSHTP